ncbi:YgaP family membrane protein [Hugenholtzia roseola]|uniref:YgaP family membrane protein n=1 Tax=Hugenholtzia roseola TaxID=1002 RepID=UPI000427831A|nr:DUF2892 domain-containing protein [Hugenholtzia roseola]
MFPTNVGRNDKILRLVFVLAMTILGFSVSSWFFLGLLPLFSVLTGYCPLYSLVGYNSCPLKK